MAKAKKKAVPGVKRWKLYEVKGDTITRKNKSCPKCGAGVLMAEHKDRRTCGMCHYTEFKKQ